MASMPNNNPLNCDHGLRRQAIVESLLREVFQGRLRAGQHLATQQLATQFGVSHTPIREALISLAGIGVIDLVPNRGAIVRRVIARDVREIFQVRRALECEAVRSACGHIDVQELQSLAKELRRLQPEQAGRLHHNLQQAERLHDKSNGHAALRQPQANNKAQMRSVDRARAVDSRLHDLICTSCGNGFLGKEIARLKTLFRAFRDLAWEHDTSHNDFRRVAEETGEHLEIVEALLAGDRRRAVKAMSHHIRSGGRYWSRVLPQEEKGTGFRVQGSAERASHAGVQGNQSKSRVRVEEKGR